MMEFKFDLQMFTIPEAEKSKEAWYDKSVPEWKTNFTGIAQNNLGGYYSGSTYYLPETTGGASSIADGFSGTVVSAELAISNNKVVPTAAAKFIGIGSGSNGITEATAGGKITFKNGAVNTMSGTVVVTVTGEVKFDGASGTVKGKDDTPTFALSGFSGTVSGNTNGKITEFTSGTVKTSSSNAAANTVMKAQFTGAATIKAVKGANNTYTYTATLDEKGKKVDLTNDDNAFNVTGSAGVDSLISSGKNNDTILAGAGNDLVTLTGGTGVVLIDGGAGSDVITSKTHLGANSTILGGDGKDTVDLQALDNTGVTTELLVNGGAGDDSVNATIASAAQLTNSTIIGGAGSDTLVTNSNSVTLTGGEGADYFDISNANYRANVSDYRYGEDFFYTNNLGTGQTAVSAANDLATATTSLENDGTSGLIKSDAFGKATVTSSSGYFAVSLMDKDKTKVDLGWVGDNKTTINGSAVNRSMVMAGTTNTEGDLLIGGAKADTLYAGANDSIYGGAGKDNLSIDGGVSGVYVGIATNSGADTVEGFTSGFDIDTADAVYLVNGTSSDFGVSYDGTDLVLDHGSAKMTISGNITGDAGANTADLLVSGQKVVVAKNKETITTDDITHANYWIGTYNSDDKTGSAANLSAVTDAVNVNLGDTDHIRYIYTVTGGSGYTTLMGGDNAERLIAASGSSTSLYSGAGKDTLVSSDDTKTEFFFMNGAGNDEIENFTTGTDADASDVLNFYGSALGSVSRTDTNVVKVRTSDGSTLSVNQRNTSADEKLQWVSGEAKGVAKIANASGSNLTYETDVTNYFGSSKKDTLTVDTGDGTDVNIWLDGSQGVSYSDIDVVDATGRAANTTIAGSAIAETITGGSGNSSVWGGVGKVADVLKSTSGSTTTFFYGLDNGNDNISGSANDTVNLFNIKLSDVTSANIQNSQVIFTTSSKDTVTVSGAQTFQLADGSTWTANYSNNQWESAQ